MEFPTLVLKHLTNPLPSAQVQDRNWNHLKGLQLADPEFSKPGSIYCILSSEVYAVIILEGLRKGPHPSPIAQNTVFGWILTESIEAPSNCKSRVSCHLIQQEDSLNDLLKMFWEIEEAPASSRLTPEEADCEAYFQATHKRDSDGCYIVKLSFQKKPDLPVFLR